MATLISYQRYFLSFSIIILHFQTLIAEPISSFSLQNFNANENPSFDLNFSLLGNAQISNEGNFVNLTSPSSSGSSSGQIIYNKPFKFLDPTSSRPTISFSTDFSFTITPGDGDGDGIAFVIFPNTIGDLSRVFDQGHFGVSDNIDGNFVAVEYDTGKDGNHVGVDLGKFESSDSSDVSSIGLLLNDGEPLRSWIDYESSSKRLEVRIGEFGSERPYQPLISSSVDFAKIWGDQEILVGISSSNRNSTQMSSLRSWSFSVRSVSSSLHSEPLNPEAPSVNEEKEHHQHGVRAKSSFLTVLGALIFFTGCGTLMAFVGLFLWVVLFGRHSNAMPELPLNQMDVKYEKVNLTVDDNVSDDTTS